MIQLYWYYVLEKKEEKVDIFDYDNDDVIEGTIKMMKIQGFSFNIIPQICLLLGTRTVFSSTQVFSFKMHSTLHLFN